MNSERLVSKRARTIVLVAIWTVHIAGVLVSLWSNAVRGTLSTSDALIAPVLLGFGVVGSLIVLRHPRHPVGWTFLVQFFFLGLDPIVEAFTLMYADRFPAPSSQLTTTLRFIEGYQESVSVTIWYSLLIIPPLYFPDGQLPSPRLRRLVWLVVALLVVKALDPQLSATWFADEQSFFTLVLTAIGDIADGLLFLAAVLAPVSLVIRFRRARGVERQQIKWPLFSALLATIGIGWLGLLYVLYRILGLGELQLSEPQESPLAIQAGGVLEVASVVTFPFTVAIGILRYQLYDIDLLINRTLVYGTLTALLALAYYGSVLLTQRILPSESPIAIVLSTLAIAALFSPLRRRIQALIDKRFYRQRYDARQALARFSEELRDDIELEQISERLLSVIDETVHPEHVSLWLRPVEK